MARATIAMEVSKRWLLRCPPIWWAWVRFMCVVSMCCGRIPEWLTSATFRIRPAL